MAAKTDIEGDVRERILQCDIAMLNDHGVSDEVLSIVSAEHAARCERICKMIDPSFGRAMLLMISAALLSAAKQIDDATVLEPEIITLPKFEDS